MGDSKVISILIIALGGFGLLLASQGKLSDAIGILLEKDSDNGTGFGRFVIAFLVYLFVISFMNERSALMTSIVIVAGALIVEKRSGVSPDTITTLLGE